MSGYNPAIHGDYDPTAWYAQKYEAPAEDEDGAAGVPLDAEAAALLLGASAGGGAFFNRDTGRSQGADQGPDRHGDEARSRRQMNAFFDVDAAANSHDGRSLKAERQSKKLTKKEIKAFRDKRREKKEEKRRAWLRD